MKNKRIKMAACVLTSSILMSGCSVGVCDYIRDALKTKEIPKGPWIVIEQQEPGIIIDDNSELQEETLIQTETPDSTTIQDITLEETESTEVIEETIEETKETIEEEEETLQESTPATIPDEETKEPEPSEKPPVPIEPPVYPEFQETKIVYAKEEIEMYASTHPNALIVSSLNINEAAYRIVSCDNGWDLVKQNTYIGYVRREKLDYSSQEFESEYIHLVHNDIVITTSPGLNFRIAPTAESEAIGSFQNNTELQVVAEANNGWLLVRYNGKLGYVHSGYTQSLLARAQELYPELDLTELSIKKVVYTTSDLNFRCGNSTEFASLGILEKYETLRVIAEYEDWYFVLSNDYNFGFVNKNYTAALTDKYVIVDKSEQRLYLYENTNLLFTTPVTTGKDETPSDTGLFSIKNKNKDVVLTDNETYWSPVKYWMRYNGGEGLHDADWRSSFGTQSYHYGGSHGCINMPPSITDEIYENVEVGTKVLVHK